jgi:hypothetical protein
MTYLIIKEEWRKGYQNYDETCRTLLNKCKAAAENGWSPIGGIAVECSDGIVAIYQAMYLQDSTREAGHGSGIE